MSTSPTPSTPIPSSDDDDPATEAAMPLTMAASMILTSLPKDATAALAGAGDLSQAKGKRAHVQLATAITRYTDNSNSAQ